MKIKECFTCKENKHIDQFFKLPEKDHTIPNDKGVSVECRDCAYNRILANGEKLHPYRKFTKYQGELRRFTSIPMDKDEAFKYCFEMSDSERKSYLRGKLNEQGLVPFNELEIIKSK